MNMPATQSGSHVTGCIRIVLRKTATHEIPAKQACRRHNPTGVVLNLSSGGIHSWRHDSDRRVIEKRQQIREYLGRQSQIRIEYGHEFSAAERCQPIVILRETSRAAVANNNQIIALRNRMRRYARDSPVERFDGRLYRCLRARQRRNRHGRGKQSVCRARLRPCPVARDRQGRSSSVALPLPTDARRRRSVTACQASPPGGASMTINLAPAASSSRIAA